MAEVVLSQMGFNYPIVLSSFYTAITWAGTVVFRRERKASKQEFDRRQWTLVSLLSVCTALNTLVGRANIAVPTTFDQTLQAVGPLLVVLLATRVFKRSVSKERKVAVIPIVLGVAMTWYSEMEISTSAVTVSVVCIVLNSMKIVINSEMLTGDCKVTPLHLLSRVSPMTLAQMSTFALVHGEVSGMFDRWREILTGWAPQVIALTGFVSFVLTLLSLHATTFATPLTVSVVGALKQVLVAGYSVVRMNRSVSRLNVVGLFFVLIGVVRYTIVSRSEKRMRRKRGAMSAGSANNKAASQLLEPTSSSASLLPTTAVRVPNNGASAAVDGVMVNGKRNVRSGGDSESRKGRGWPRTMAMTWVRRLWVAENGDVSHRNR